MPAPATWSAPASGGSISGVSPAYLPHVTKAGSYWFATVSSGTGGTGGLIVRYASDPTGAWTTATVPAAPGSTRTNRISGVAFDGTTYALAVEYYYGIGPVRNMRIIYTTDPTSSWSYYDYDSGNQHAPLDLRYLNGEWVMTGVKWVSGAVSPGFVGTASTATGTWTFNTSILPTSGGSSAYYEATGIDYDGSTYALGYRDNIVGANERTYTAATIGGTWTQGSTYIRAGGPMRYFVQGDAWAIPNDQGALYYAADSTGSWTSFAGDTDGGITNFAVIQCVNESPEYWVIGGSNAASSAVKLGYKSLTGGVDGTYTEITDHDITSGGSVNYVASIAYADGYFVLLSANNCEIRVTYVGTGVTAPALLRQRQSPKRTPSRVRGVDLRQRQTPTIR